MSSNLKKRLTQLKNRYDLDKYTGIVFVEFHDGKFQVKRQEHTPKFIGTNVAAEFESEREARDYIETMDGENTIFWDIFPETIEEWENSHR